MTTQIIGFDALELAAEALRQGQCVACPTETVYGLLADASSEEAILRIFAAKRRPETKPISVFVSRMEEAERLCQDIPPLAYAWAAQYWPGPLTMVLPKRPEVSPLLTAGGDALGVRCPASRAALALLRLTGLPLTGTSANLSGQPAATTAAEALAAFDGRIPYIIDDGALCGGLPSTVVSLTGDAPQILRQGGITL